MRSKHMCTNLPWTGGPSCKWRGKDSINRMKSLRHTAPPERWPRRWVSACCSRLSGRWARCSASGNATEPPLLLVSAHPARFPIDCSREGTKRASRSEEFFSCLTVHVSHRVSRALHCRHLCTVKSTHRLFALRLSAYCLHCLRLTQRLHMCHTHIPTHTRSQTCAMNRLLPKSKKKRTLCKIACPSVTAARLARVLVHGLSPARTSAAVSLPLLPLPVYLSVFFCACAATWWSGVSVSCTSPSIALRASFSFFFALRRTLLILLRSATDGSSSDAAPLQEAAAQPPKAEDFVCFTREIDRTSPSTQRVQSTRIHERGSA